MRLERRLRLLVSRVGGGEEALVAVWVSSLTDVSRSRKRADTDAYLASLLSIPMILV